MRVFPLHFVAFLWIVLFFTPTTELKGQNTDILHQEISLDASRIFSHGLVASSTLTLTNHNQAKIQLDLQGFNVDSVLINDYYASFSKSDSTLLINIPEVVKMNDTLSVHIHYSGQPAKDATWGGFYINNPYAFNMGVGFSSKPHNFGRAWFPCNDNFTDKALYDIIVVTPKSFNAICSGILQADSLLTDSLGYFHWKVNQPIPTYLVGIAIGKYSLLHSSISGTNSPIPSIIAVEAKDTVAARAAFERLNEAVDCFEEKFGPYVFDRIGYVGVPFNAGAMEHAMSIAYPLYAINTGNPETYETLMAHELSHHWWGNEVTCETAEDVWLNEGWASFCEALFLECVHGKTAYTNDIISKKLEVLLSAAADDKGHLAVSGVQHQNTYGTTVYKKGALMTHLLRTTMGDSAFFAACRAILIKYKFKNINSEMLKNEFQAFTNADLSFFFNQFIYQPGHYDVVPAGTHIENGKTTCYFALRSKLKTALLPNVKTDVTIHYKNGTSQEYPIELTNGIGNLLINDTQAISYFTFDKNEQFLFANTYENLTLKSRGARNTNNTLFGINVQTINPGDSAQLTVLHHWVGPTFGNFNQTGIRVSTDRYWQIRGLLPQGFSAWAFFSYDGSTNFTDSEIFNYTNTEDSLVLLYRMDENQPWEILSSNVTYQPGGNPRDKMGRFWLTQFRTGDYTFGVRDKSAVGLKPAQLKDEKDGLKLFPNPVSGKLSLCIPEEKLYHTVEINITNIAGIRVINQTIEQSSNILELDASKLTPGTYFVQVKTNKETYNKKFVIE